MSRLLILIIIAGTMLGGCVTPPPERPDPSVDSAPTDKVDVSRIPDVIPQPVTRTRAGNMSPYTVLGNTYEVLPSSEGFTQEGTASWYGRKFHGRHTSNGESFDMYGMTAAHKNLPIPTYVEVTNMDNGRRAVLRVNDRGPFHGDRVIDLSWAAAAKLGFAEQGTAHVQIRALDTQNPLADLNNSAVPLSAEPSRAQVTGDDTVSMAEISAIGDASVEVDIPGKFVLADHSYYQVAALSAEASARKLASEIEAFTKYPVQVRGLADSGSRTFKVLIGPLLDRREVNTLSLIMELAGMSPGFLVEQSF